MADQTTENEESPKKVDEIDELLSSALDDFDEPLSSVDETPVLHGSKKKKIQPGKLRQVDFEDKFASLLLGDKADTTFSNDMSCLLNEVESRIQTSPHLDPGSESSDDDTVNQAVDSLMESMEQIRNGIGSDQLPDNFNVGNIPMMEQMFQMLMSKEVLYPSLQSVRERYPKWLEEIGKTVSSEEFNRYTRQYEIIDQICVIFESEKQSDTEQIKHERFNQLMDLLQKMSESGQPPKDLAESLPSMGSGMIDADIDPNNCNIM